MSPTEFKSANFTEHFQVPVLSVLCISHGLLGQVREEESNQRMRINDQAQRKRSQSVVDKAKICRGISMCGFWSSLALNVEKVGIQ